MLHQTALDPKHGMCMSVAFLPPPGPAPTQRGAPSTSPAHTTCRESGPEAGHGIELGSPARGRDEAGNGQVEAEQDSGNGAGAVAESGGGPVHVVTGYEDGVVALWDVRAPGRPLGELRQHQEPVLCVAAWRAPGRGGAAGAGPGAEAAAVEVTQGGGEAADSKEAGGLYVWKGWLATDVCLHHVVEAGSHARVAGVRPGG